MGLQYKYSVECSVHYLVKQKETSHGEWSLDHTFNISANTIEELSIRAYKLTPDPESLSHEISAVRATGLIPIMSDWEHIYYQNQRDSISTQINILKRRMFTGDKPDDMIKEGRLVPFVIDQNVHSSITYSPKQYACVI